MTSFGTAMHLHMPPRRLSIKTEQRRRDERGRDSQKKPKRFSAFVLLSLVVAFSSAAVRFCTVSPMETTEAVNIAIEREYGPWRQHQATSI